MLSVQCPKCGGTNTFDETKKIPTYCSFCGTSLPDMKEFVKESLKLKIDKQRHSMDMEYMEQEIRKARVTSSPMKWKMIICAACILLTAAMFIIIAIKF